MGSSSEAALILRYFGRYTSGSTMKASQKYNKMPKGASTDAIGLGQSSSSSSPLSNASAGTEHVARSKPAGAYRMSQPNSMSKTAMLTMTTTF